MNAAAMSLFRMLGDLGYVVGPIVLGLVTDAWRAPTGPSAGGRAAGRRGVLFARRAPETYGRMRAAP